jgi:hypothetical protein
MNGATVSTTLLGRRRLGLAGLLLAIAAIAMATQAAAPAAAEAHSCQYAATIHVGGATGCTFYNGGWIKVCDTQKDGHRARIQYTTTFPSYQYPVKKTGWAPSGGCHEQGTGGDPGPVADFRVCIEREGCTAWKQNNGTDADVVAAAEANGGCYSYDDCSRKMFIYKAQANQASQEAILYNAAADQAAARGDSQASSLYRAAAAQKYGQTQLLNIAYQNAEEQRSLYCNCD